MINFSCIMTVYSGTVLIYFEEAIQSVVKQTVLPNEIIIVVDGAIQQELTAYIDDLISKTKEVEIKKITLEKNSGAGPARNI